ncbi:Uncharacterised protein [Sphingobacterium thalpophilum]|uniref:Uncharacterized protein n=1 Tax=Sphingobacterium thalpophilum TaxID=259 RepID=A0A4U9VV00_9SPHI|nr:Uncharacterised protein [Sphingobacterium thalpophilum]
MVKDSFFSDCSTYLLMNEFAEYLVGQTNVLNMFFKTLYIS